MALAVEAGAGMEFEDYFPRIMESVGLEGLVGELCNGFLLLMDVEKGVITFDSLKRNSYLLGLHDIADDDVLCMLQEGDLNGDGHLDKIEFCVLMFRLSPSLMDLATTCFLVDLTSGSGPSDAGGGGGGASTGGHPHQYNSAAAASPV